MSQRNESRASRDDFPTPPWATRALLKYVIPEVSESMSCLEPACGAGHMSKVLEEYFPTVVSSDIYEYQYGTRADFLAEAFARQSYDWVITNPPFRHAEEFIAKALDIATEGVAILARTVFLESVGRYKRLFESNPPSVFAQFVERVPMVKGRLDPKASTATGYSWFVWKKNCVGSPRLIWIPPCRRALECEGDYMTPSQSIESERLAYPLAEELQKSFFPKEL